MHSVVACHSVYVPLRQLFERTHARTVVIMHTTQNNYRKRESSCALFAFSTLIANFGNFVQPVGKSAENIPRIPTPSHLSRSFLLPRFLPSRPDFRFSNFNGLSVMFSKHDRERRRRRKNLQRIAVFERLPIKRCRSGSIGKIRTTEKRRWRRDD